MADDLRVWFPLYVSDMLNSRKVRKMNAQDFGTRGQVRSPNPFAEDGHKKGMPSSAASVRCSSSSTTSGRACPEFVEWADRRGEVKSESD